MLLYVAAGQVFTSLEKAAAAANGNTSAVKSFPDFFSAEEFASGGACDAASTTAACLADSRDPGPPSGGLMWAPPVKRQRYERAPRNVGPPRYADTSERIRAALARWEPHPDFAGALKLSHPRGEGTEAASGAAEARVFDRYQESAVSAARRGESFLLTGSAGTGKSYVLKRVIAELRQEGRRVTVTASTGCAAVGIQGSTVHSALQLGIGNDTDSALCNRIRSKRMIRKRSELMNMDVLVIDEISMVDKKLFETVEVVVRSARCRTKSHPVKCTFCPLFGGVQVIVCGDFFQLPPVQERGAQVSFCFQSKVFKKLIKNVYRLRLVHRQDDWHFVGMLNELRRGVVTPSTQRVLAACRVPSGLRHEELDEQGNPVCFTKLFPYREQVRRENMGCLQKLRSQAVVYECTVIKQPNANRRAVENGVKNLRVDSTIELRLGARVLCMKNLDVEGGICNGSPGQIVGFYPVDLTARELNELEGKPRKEGDKKAEKQGEKQEPVAKIEPDVVRSDGTPVSKFAMRARSRLTADEDGGPALNDVTNAAVGDNSGPGVEFMRMKEAMKRKKADETLDDPVEEGQRLLKKAVLHPELKVPWLKMAPAVVPMVKFDNGVTRRIFPEVWEIRAANGNIEARVTQIPLSLGYALSIHKSQGMTLARVQADLGGAFDCGQVYVALSRVSSIDGLRLPSFDARKVSAHNAVRDFEMELDSRDG